MHRSVSPPAKLINRQRDARADGTNGRMDLNFQTLHGNSNP
jgi:hypothetical protein